MQIQLPSDIDERIEELSYVPFDDFRQAYQFTVRLTDGQVFLFPVASALLRSDPIGQWALTRYIVNQIERRLGDGHE